MGVQAPVSARPNAAWRPLYSVLGDDRLARLVSDGNKQAFAPLYERYYQQLYRYCRSIVHDDLDAQDALQSTFASAFAALRKGQRDAPLRPWLFRIAHNEAVSVIRR
ncbi:MAG: RNA polymerase sigma factor, partial [Solirubrobacteraceae bacterium]